MLYNLLNKEIRKSNPSNDGLLAAFVLFQERKFICLEKVLYAVVLLQNSEIKILFFSNRA